jgi:predicted nucleotidyltransferase
MVNPALRLPQEKLAAFCRCWRITSLELFGSALRDDFGPESDVDLLVTFEQDAPWSLFDVVQIESELAAILGRRIDLVERASIERSDNWIRRRAILGSVEPLYGSR